MSHKLVSLYIGEGEYYTRTDADNALAEKDEEIAQLKADYSAKVEELCIEKTNVDTLEQAWKQSQRALWLARGWRAWCEGQFWLVLDSSKPRDIYHLICSNRIHRTPNEWITYWYKVEQLCEKKAEEYK